MYHILCYGDSNTWGFDPRTHRRYDESTRWTGVLAEALGPSYRVHENGLNSRTTIFDSPFKPYLNGLASLPVTLQTQKPLDLLIFSLGTNDLKTHSVWHSAQGMERLIRAAQCMDALFPSAEPVFRGGRARILVLCPIAIRLREQPGLHDDLMGKGEESLLFPEAYRAVCERCGVVMLNAQAVAEPSKVDGVHMDPAGHRALGLAVKDQVMRLLAEP